MDQISIDPSEKQKAILFPLSRIANLSPTKLLQDLQNIVLDYADEWMIETKKIGPILKGREPVFSLSKNKLLTLTVPFRHATLRILDLNSYEFEGEWVGFYDTCDARDDVIVLDDGRIVVKGDGSIKIWTLKEYNTKDSEMCVIS